MVSPKIHTGLKGQKQIMVCQHNVAGHVDKYSAPAMIELMELASIQAVHDLLEEGLCREVVNRVQSLRKSLDLGYTDRIRLGLGGDPALLAAVRRFWSYVAHETLSVELVSAPANASSVQVDGRTLLLWAQRV